MTPLLLTISSGTGPIEARHFVRMLADALEREVAERGAVVEHTRTHGPVDSPSSVDLVLRGDRASVADLVGTHELVMRSDRREKRSRKRWYAGVSCVSRDEAREAGLDLRDVLFETCRAGGAGGQHVNKTESAVRAHHRPSGLSVRIESERSQHQNKRAALEEIGRLLAQRARERSAAAKSARRDRSLQVERGAAVATWSCAAGGLVRVDKSGERDAE